MMNTGGVSDLFKEFRDRVPAHFKFCITLQIFILP